MSSTNTVKREQSITPLPEANSSRYSFISFQLRSQLIRLVEQEKYSVYRASRMLNIKNSTAKVIMRQFKRKGHVFRRKCEVSPQNEPLPSEYQPSVLPQAGKTLMHPHSADPSTDYPSSQLNVSYMAFYGFQNCLSQNLLMLYMIQ